MSIRCWSCRRLVNFLGPATSCQSHSFCWHMNDSDVSIGASVFQRRSSSRQRRNSSPQCRCLTSWSTRYQSWSWWTRLSHSLFESISVTPSCLHDRNHLSVRVYWIAFVSANSVPDQDCPTYILVLLAMIHVEQRNEVTLFSLWLSVSQRLVGNN